MIVIIGTQSFEVAATLSSSQVPSVKVGDSAAVQVDGVNGTIEGTVSQVGPVQSGQSGYTYPVVVALPSSATGLFTGSTANVVIATGAVAHVVAVPTSAVQTLGSRSFVEVLSDGTLTRKLIKVGMVGDTYTQVLSGLTLGQSVVLADYSLPVPSSNTNTFGGFGGGGFGGWLRRRGRLPHPAHRGRRRRAPAALRRLSSGGVIEAPTGRAAPVPAGTVRLTWTPPGPHPRARRPREVGTTMATGLSDPSPWSTWTAIPS